MRAINATEALTPREREQFEQEKQIAELQAEYGLKIKQLEVDLLRVETKWTQLFRLPFAVLMLPVRFILALSYVVHAIRRVEPSEKFWDYLTKL